MTIRAISENGVFRPVDKVDLPDKSQVLFEPRVVGTDNTKTPAMAKIYEILSRTYETGQPDLAQRHDKHQP